MASLGKKFLVYGLCAMLGSPFTVMPSSAFAGYQKVTGFEPITIYEGGTIYTLQETQEEVAKNIAPKKAEIVVVQGDKIVYAGDKSGATQYTRQKGVQFVDLGNNVMLPGFIDPHGHFPSATPIQSIDLNPSPIQNPGIDTIEALQNKLRDKAKERDYAGKGINWIQGFGYDDTMLKPSAHPTQEQLSAGELQNYNVSITHISGHMACANTKALSKLFDESYVKGTLTNVLKKQNYISPTNSITKFELVDHDGKVEYQVTLQNKDDLAPNKGNIVVLPGLQMKPNAAELLKQGKKVECFTGLLIEGAKSYIAPDFAKGDKVFEPLPGVDYSYASKEYASRGVTMANHGGTTNLAGTIKSAQQALLDGKLTIRMNIQPRVYSNLGTGINDDTLTNHYALAWTGMDTTNPDPLKRTIGSPKEESPQTGMDITQWYPGEGTKAKPGSATPEVGSSAEKLKNAGVTDMLHLGTWKYTYDGSIQGYTGYLSQKGYYKKPADTAPFNPAGRTGDAKKGGASYVIGGTVSVTDPEYFCRAEDHYGNENSLSTSTYDIGAKTIMDYHTQKQGVSLHLNGSWANDDVVNFVEQAVAANPGVKDTRHTVIHAQMQELQHIQRFMGNYDQFPIRTPEEVKRFGTVWTGVNAMEWVEGVQKPDVVGKNYNPVEGEYLDKFDTKNPNKGTQLREKLGKGEKSLMRAQNVISSYFVDHTYYWGERHRDIFMGPGRAYNMSPMGWAVLLGHRYTLHNDTPVTPQNPLKSISIATTRLSSGYEAGGIKHEQQPIHGTAGIKELGQVKSYPATVEDGEKGILTEFHDFDQRITVLQALHALTVNSAFSSKLENRFGQIKEGYFADFVILAQDPFELEKQGQAGLLKIADIPVVTTIVGGEVVFGFLPGTQAGDFVENLEVSVYNDKGTTVTNIVENDNVTSEEVTAMKDGAKHFYGYKKFTADVTSGKSATFTIQVMGNNAPVSSLEVQKLLDTSAQGKLPFKFADKVTLTDGAYFITDRTIETVLKATDTMQAGKAYYIHFTITDGGQYDTDKKANGKIVDPTFVTSDASFPVAPTADNNGGGAIFFPDNDGGCTVGTNPHYDFAILFMGALGLLVVRIMRRREQD